MEKKLRAKNTKIVETPAFHKRFEVVEPVFLLEFLLVPTEGTPFSSLLSLRCHVMEPREKASGLRSDDGDRNSSSQVVKKKAFFRRRHWPAFQKRDVFGLGDCKFLDQVMKILGNLSILTGHKTNNVTESKQTLL